MRESKVENYLLDQCTNQGWPCWKFVSPGRVGVPDRVVLLPERKVAWVEVKGTGGVLSSAQRRLIVKMFEHGLPVSVVRCYEDVDEFITMWKERLK